MSWHAHPPPNSQPFPTKDQIGKDFQRIKDEEDIRQVFHHFLNNFRDHSNDIYSANDDNEVRSQEESLKQQLIKRLHELRSAFTNSEFFSRHEVIGSSLLVIHDTQKLGVWMIDFAKSIPLPPGTSVDHVSPWKLGNHEDGYLFGLQNLIHLMENL